MNLLRHIFFGIVQIIELPVNIIIELWRLPGRGRGLLFGFPSFFVLILTLLAIGWAKYGSNQALIDEYWRHHSRDGVELKEINILVGRESPDSTLGQFGVDEETSADTADVAKPKTPPAREPDNWQQEIVHTIAHEIEIPDLDDEAADPQVRVRVELGDKRNVEKVTVIQASGSAEWDEAVKRALERTQVFVSVQSNEAKATSHELEFGLLNSRRDKLMYTMSIGLKKLIDLDPSNPEYKYELGLLYEQMDNLPQAKLLMDQVAPADKPGLCRGHVWQARRIWEDETRKESISSKKNRCMNHLRLALASDPTDIAANEGLGELFFSLGNYREAEKYFRLVWERQLSPTLRLFAIYRILNEPVKVNELLSHARLRLEDQLKRDPNDVRLILDVQRILMLQGKMPEAVEWLNSHITEENRKLIHNRLARVYTGWAKGLAVQNNGIFSEEAFEKAKLALELDPTLDDAMWIITMVGTQGQPYAADAFALYDPVQNRETAPGIVLREYSTYLIRQGKYKEAIAWLEEAYQRYADDTITANNLAYLLITSDPPQLERSLKIITEAIEKSINFASPELRANLYDTKAAVLVALNRHVDAIPYLEACLQFRVNNRVTMESLRDCYQAIDRQEMADFYQRRLDALANTTPPQQ